MKKIVSILTGSLLLTTCLLLATHGNQIQAQVKQPFELRISTGTIPAGSNAYLVYQSKGTKFFDSAVVTDGLLHFKGTLEKPLRATLVLDGKQIGLTALLRSEPDPSVMLKLILCPGITTGSTRSDIAAVVFPKPGINHDFGILTQRMKKVHDHWAVVSRQLVKETDTNQVKILRRLYDSLRVARIPILRQFVIDYPDSFVALEAWEEYKGLLSGNLGAALEAANLEKCRQLFEMMTDRLKSSDDAMEARRFFANNKALKPGAPAPAFSQPDPNGKIVRLSDFRGRYVLIDFWASWCGPCRVNNPALKKLYDEFSNRNFTILGISLDAKDGRQRWETAIREDGLSWPQVSDLQHWDNAVARLYSIDAVPYNLLIGPDGIIISHDTPVEGLRPLLEKLLPVAH